MKKKLLSLILMLCICFSFLTGCSLTYTDNSYKDSDIVMTVGQTDITRKDLVEQYNNFYSQYYQYFMYYDSNTMMDLFYNAVVSRAIVLEKANELKNQDVIRFYTEDYEEIWNKIYDFINSQLDTKEKALILQSGVKEENLPKRLQDEEEAEKTYVYEEYKLELLEKPDFTAEKDEELNFDDQYKYLKETAIYTYNAEKDEEKDRDTQNILEAEKPIRLVAFNQYIEALSIAAKASGKAHDLDSVLKEEVKRLYKTYYESELYSKYQEYTEGKILDDGLLDDESIVSKFIELTNKDTQNNANEENYIDVLTSGKNESLILYHNNCEYTYFTVQHILIKYESETLEDLKQHVGYLSTVNSIYRNEYNEYREMLVNNLGGKLAMETSYRDSEGKLVTETVGTGDDEKQVLSKVTVQDILDEFDTEVGKIASPTERDIAMIFNKLSWKYSDDTGSLTTNLSNKIGFTISEEIDNHGSYVVDFANGARDLFEEYKNGNVEVGQVLTDYGLHLMLVTGAYDIADGEEGSTLVDIINGNNYRDIDDIVTDLKANYVSNMSEQRLYDYIYDILKDELVGTNGTYFSKHRNKLQAQYEEEGKIKDENKLSYEELSSAIGV